MFEKEKKALSFLGVVVSLVVLISIIIFGMDFTDVKLRLTGKTLMKQLKHENYEELYKQYVPSYNVTINQYIEEQKRLKTLLGNLKSYRFDRCLKKQDEGYVSLVYDAVYTNFKDKKISCTWDLCRSINGWEILDLQLNSDEAALQEKIYSKKEQQYISQI
ncbi:MAG: hypothetical protein PHD60_07105, partial [Clostridia bacterium]|nr:hypothetical protein [Clostridia bacterium]